MMRNVWIRSSGVVTLAAACAALGGCSGAPSVGVHESAVTATEDGLAEAYGIFKQTFVNDGEDHRDRKSVV